MKVVWRLNACFVPLAKKFHDTLQKYFQMKFLLNKNESKLEIQYEFQKLLDEFVLHSRLSRFRLKDHNLYQAETLVMNDESQLLKPFRHWNSYSILEMNKF